MSPKDIVCKKRNGKSFFIDLRGNNTGLYCGDCGAWQKWLKKDENNAWQHYLEQLDEMRILNDGNINIPEPDTKTNELLNQIKEFCKWIGNEINHENEMRPMVSNIDAVRSLSYCYGLQQIGRMLDNIIAGREYNDDGGNT